MGDPKNHDEMCPRGMWFRSTYTTCQCHLIRRVEARERARLRTSVATLGGHDRKPDEYVAVGVVLMLLEER